MTAEDTTRVTESPVPGAQVALRGEKSDSYPGVVARLNDHWRVIVSRDRPPYRQWILQRSRSRHGRTEWEGHSYCQGRTALLRSIREKIVNAPDFYPRARAMPVDEAAMAILEALPERIGQEQLP